MRRNHCVDEVSPAPASDIIDRLICGNNLSIHRDHRRDNCLIVINASLLGLMRPSARCVVCHKCEEHKHVVLESYQFPHLSVSPSSNATAR